MNEHLEAPVQEDEALSEIQMMTNLIIATSESDGPLARAQIDSILGVFDDAPPI